VSSLQDDGLLRDIAATPRPTGSVAIASARSRCARELRALGFQVREHPFEFSSFPGRFATPLVGGAVAAIVGVAGHLGAEGSRFIPLVVVALAGVALFEAGGWLVERGVLVAPVLRERGVNLEATRREEMPRVWLCAHLDTKSQPIPTLIRSFGIVLLATGYLMTAGLALLSAAGAPQHSFFWAAAALVTLVGVVPVVLSVVGQRSAGALDNASGVATVIAAARALGDEVNTGVLITDAEELGLAGARAWVGVPQRKGTTVLNCDGVDDDGRVVVMFNGAMPKALIGAVERASERIGVAYRPMRMVPGLLTDSVAFASAGLSSVTFSRGSLGSLARVHSSRDDLNNLRGTGIAETARLMAATAREIGEMR
jgi:hypothetical protein